MRKPKPIKLTFEPWPEPNPNTLYPGQIAEVAAKKGTLSIAIVNLHTSMFGRRHLVGLLASLHPDSRTHRFASAAGLEVNAFGDEIDLRETIGATVGMRFIFIGDDYEIQFEKVIAKTPPQTQRAKTDSAKPSDEESPPDLEDAPDSDNDFLAI